MLHTRVNPFQSAPPPTIHDPQPPHSPRSFRCIEQTQELPHHLNPATGIYDGSLYNQNGGGGGSRSRPRITLATMTVLAFACLALAATTTVSAVTKQSIDHARGINSIPNETPEVMQSHTLCEVRAWCARVSRTRVCMSTARVTTALVLAPGQRTTYPTTRASEALK